MAFIQQRRASLSLLAGLVVSAPLSASEYSVFNPHPDMTRTADGGWEMHSVDRPQPPKVDPKPEAELADSAKVPEGAIVLFDGKNLDAWNVPQPWTVEGGTLRLRPVQTSLQSKQPFGSCRLHLEWKTQPGNPNRTGQQRGNSGVFLMSTYEVQVLDTYENTTYADGMAGAIYGVKPPDANPLRPPGEWQYYDIWFKRPVFDANGKMVSPACVTVMINGVIVQDNIPFDGPSSYKRRSAYRPHPEALPLMLQNHNDTVDFRNIWIQPLPDDAVISPAGPVGVNKP